MIWQEIVFMVGSALSIFVLMPTLQSTTSIVPWKTSVPSAALGAVYAVTFVSLGMAFAAAGAFAAGAMWSLIALYRSPRSFLDIVDRDADSSSGDH